MGKYDEFMKPASSSAPSDGGKYAEFMTPSKSWGQAAVGEASAIPNSFGELGGAIARTVGNLNIPSTLERFSHPFTNDNNEFSQQVQQAGQQLYKDQKAQVDAKTANETPLQRDTLGSVAAIPKFAAEAALGPAGLFVGGASEAFSNSQDQGRSLGNSASDALAGGAINTIAGQARINSLMSPSANVAQAVGKNALAGAGIGVGANAAQQAYDATVNGKDFSGSELGHSGIAGAVGGGVGGAATHPLTRSAHPTYWTNMVNKNADKAGVDGNLANRVLFVESSGNPDALSGKNAMGLMQLTDPALKDLGLTRADVKNPAANIRAGVQYLGKMIGLFDGDEQKGVAAYNAGQGAVKRAIAKATAEGNPDSWMLHLPPETQGYLGKIFGPDKAPMTHDQWVQHVASNPDNGIMSKDQWFQDRNSADRQNPLDEGYSDYVNRRIQEQGIQKPAHVADQETTPTADRLSQTATDSFMGRVNAATDESVQHPYDPNIQANGHAEQVQDYHQNKQAGESFQEYQNRKALEQPNQATSSNGLPHIPENPDPNEILPASQATTSSHGTLNYNEAGSGILDKDSWVRQQTNATDPHVVAGESYGDYVARRTRELAQQGQQASQPIVHVDSSQAVDPVKSKFNALTSHIQNLVTNLHDKWQAAEARAQSGVKQHRSAATRAKNQFQKALAIHGFTSTEAAHFMGMQQPLEVKPQDRTPFKPTIGSTEPTASVGSVLHAGNKDTFIATIKREVVQPVRQALKLDVGSTKATASVSGEPIQAGAKSTFSAPIGKKALEWEGHTPVTEAAAEAMSDRAAAEVEKAAAEKDIPPAKFLEMALALYYAGGLKKVNANLRGVISGLGRKMAHTVLAVSLATPHGQMLPHVTINIGSGEIQHALTTRAAVNWVHSESKGVQAAFAAGSREAQGHPFVIADKPNGQIILVDGNGGVIKRAPALFGADKGDVRQHINYNEKQPPAGMATTPAGHFNVSRVDNLYGGNGYSFMQEEGDKYDYTIAIHRMVNEGDRAKRIKSSNPNDHRVSWGCINAPADFMSNYMDKFAGVGTNIYVVPDDENNIKGSYHQEATWQRGEEPGSVAMSNGIDGQPAITRRENQTANLRYEEPIQGKSLWQKMVDNYNAPRSAKITRGQRGAILAWHGTHRDDINKFSNKYIGTGEGAQAFGHGLYFAGNKRTAEHYQEQGAFLHNQPDWLHDGKPVSVAAHETINMGHDGNVYRAIEDARDWLEEHPELANHPGWEHLRELASMNPSKVKQVGGGKGKLYKIDLEPDHNTLLHWDRPFSEQTKHVQDSVHNALQRLIFFHRKRGNTDAKEAAIDLKMALEDSPSTISGEKVYRSLTANLGSDKHASNWLSNHGVDGIKYLDAISRHDHHPDYENSTEHNYVMFNDKHVKILKAGQEVTNRAERLKRIQELKNRQAMKSAPPEVKVDRREDLMTRLRRQNEQSVRMAGFGKKQRGAMSVPFGDTAEALRNMWENRKKGRVAKDTSSELGYDATKDRLIHNPNSEDHRKKYVKDDATGQVKSSDVSWMNRKIFSKGITPDWLAQMNRVIQWPIRQVMKVKDNNYNASHGLIDEKLAGYDKLSDEEKIHVAKLANYFDHHRIDPTSQSVAQTLTSPKWGGTFKASSKAQEFYLKAMEAGKTTLARVNAQRNMAGMPEIQAMPGHWPHLWKNGDFSVEVHDTQGNKVHQEKFDNRIAANKAQLRLKKQFPNHEVSAPKEVEPQDLNHRNVDEDALWGAKQLADHLNASQDVRDFLNRFESEVVGKRGYGVHSVQRKNVGGYLGDHADPRKAADEYVESLQRDIHSAHTYAGNLEIGRTVGDYVSKLGDEHKNARGLIYDYLHAVNSSNPFSKTIDSAAAGFARMASLGFLGREMNVLSRNAPMKFIRWANVTAMHAYLFWGNVRYLAAAVRQPLINTNLRILQLGSEGLSKTQFHAIPEAIKADAMAMISLAQYHAGVAPQDVKDFISWAHKNGATGSRFIDDVMPGMKGAKEWATGVKLGKMAENEGHLLSALMMYHYLKGKQGFSKQELYEGAKQASIEASGRFQKWGKVMALNMMGNKGEAVGAMKTWLVNALSQQVHMLRMLPRGKVVPILGYMAAQWYMTGLMGIGYREDVDKAIEAINEHFNTTFPTLSEKMRGMSNLAKFGPEQALSHMQHNQTMKGPGFTDLGDMVGVGYAGKGIQDVATLGSHWAQGTLTDADKEKALTDILPASMHGEIENYYANKHNSDVHGVGNLFQTPTSPVSDPNHRDQGKFYRNNLDNLARMLTTRSNREVNTLEGLREAQSKEAAQQKSTQAIVSTVADGMRNGTLSQLDLQHLYQKAYENGTDARLLMRDAMNLYKNGYKTNALRFVGNLKTLDQRNKYNTLLEMGIDPFALGGGADSYE